MKKIIAAVAAAIVVAGAAGVPCEIGASPAQSISAAADSTSTVVYNGDTMATFKNRTASAVKKKYLAALNTETEGSLYTKEASISYPYAAGTLKKSTVKSMQAMTDFYRWLVGVNPLKTDCVPTASLQYQALDRNFEFNHYISESSKPSDMDQALWDKGFECTHNILAIGYGAQGAITGWMNEGYSGGTWNTLGHRYAMISASLSEIQYGYSGYVAIGSCEAYNNGSAKEAFSAFPAPGYNPSNLISSYSSAWSIELNDDNLYYTDESKLKVKVTNTSTKKSYTCTEANGKLMLDGWWDCIAFAQPDTSYSYYTDSYSVDITGLKDVSTGKAAEIKYTVKFADMSHTHNYTAKKAVVKPTYTSKGYTKYYCSCGKYTKGDYKAAKTIPAVTTKSEFGTATNAVRIKWNKVAGVSGYKIFRYNTSTKKWDAVGKVTNNSTFSYRDTKNLKAGTTYKYKVQAFVKGSDGKYYYGKLGTTAVTATTPAAVKITRTVSSNSVVRVEWNKVACSGYKLDKYDPALKKWVNVAYVANPSATSYRFTGLKSGTTYKFRVTAYKKPSATSAKKVAAKAVSVTASTKK